jgi:hypothetical protein
MSDADIAPGSVWFSEIQREIKETQYAIACITRTNVNSSWVLWEAGALYGKLANRSRLAPVLFDVSKDAVSGPLRMFQLTEGADRHEVNKLLHDISSLTPYPVSSRDIDDNFDKAWPDFHQLIANIIRKHQVYAFTWSEQIEVFKRICGDPQKILLFMINTGATIDQVRNLRWSYERRGPDDASSVFVIRDKPPEILVLNSIARRIVVYMRDGHHQLASGHEEFVFGHPDAAIAFDRPERRKSVESRQRRARRRRINGDAHFPSFAIAHQNLRVIKVDVLYPQPQCFQA